MEVSETVKGDKIKNNETRPRNECLEAVHNKPNNMCSSAAQRTGLPPHKNYYGPGTSPKRTIQFYDQSSFILVPVQVSRQPSPRRPHSEPGTQGNSSIQPAGGWWTAFGTGGFEGSLPCLRVRAQW